MLEGGGTVVKKMAIFWAGVFRPLIYLTILVFGTLGLVLSWQQLSPVIAVTSGRLGILTRMLMDMLEFAHLGI